MSSKSILSHFWLLLFLACLNSPEKCDGKNILFFFGMSTYSHRITAWPLATKLAEQGHSVTFLQVYENKSPHPKITEFIPDNVTPMVPFSLVDLRAKYGKLLVYVMVHYLPEMGASMCDQFLNSSKNIDWVNRQHFDLVVLDALFNDCMLIT